MVWCVMVKGPCRGERCDFWARVRLRHQSVEEIANGILESIRPCGGSTSQGITDALDRYWKAVGVKDMYLLCQEEKDLCAKIRHAEGIALSKVQTSS